MSQDKAKDTAKAVKLKDLTKLEKAVRNAAMAIQRGENKLAKTVRDLFTGADTWAGFLASVDRIRAVLTGGEPVRGNANESAYRAVSTAVRRVRETVAVSMDLPVDASAKAVDGAAKKGGKKAHAAAVAMLDGSETLTPPAVAEAKDAAADKREKKTRSRREAAKAPTAKVIPGGKDAADRVKLAREALAACGLSDSQQDSVIAHVIGLMEYNARNAKDADAKDTKAA